MQKNKQNYKTEIYMPFVIFGLLLVAEYSFEFTVGWSLWGVWLIAIGISFCGMKYCHTMVKERKNILGGIFLGLFFLKFISGIFFAFL